MLNEIQKQQLPILKNNKLIWFMKYTSYFSWQPPQEFEKLFVTRASKKTQIVYFIIVSSLKLAYKAY